MEEMNGTVDRLAALEAKCYLLSASLKKSDAVRDQMAAALKEARRHVPARHAAALMQIDAALAAVGGM